MFVSSARNISIDGKADDWGEIPEIVLGPESSVKFAVSKGNPLYCDANS